MTDSSVLLTIDERGVATVCLNRPDRHNAFDENVIAELHACFAHLRGNEKVRAMVLTAQGKSFSAGADLEWMRRSAEYDFNENLADARNLAEMLKLLNELPFPTLARVHGAAYGGGVGLVACCDIVFASPAAKFCLSEVKLGLVPGTVSPYVVNAMGARLARRYFISAESFDADTACKSGLISEVVAEESLDARIETELARLLANSPAAMAASKGLVSQVMNRPVDEKLLHETSEAIALARTSIEGREGVKAFLEKRKAFWQ